MSFKLVSRDAMLKEVWVSCGVMRLLQWDMLVLDFVVRALEKINVNKLLGLVEVNEWQIVFPRTIQKTIR